MRGFRGMAYTPGIQMPLTSVHLGPFGYVWGRRFDSPLGN